MKISNGSSPKPATATVSGRVGAKGSAASATTAGKAAANTNAAGTDPAARLSQLEAQFAQADFNAAKVSEVTSAIAAGRYQVNAGAVADKLLQSAASLSRKNGRNT
jgi:negative regulator of flagellin synthesis FlgM